MLDGVLLFQKVFVTFVCHGDCLAFQVHRGIRPAGGLAQRLGCSGVAEPVRLLADSIQRMARIREQEVVRRDQRYSQHTRPWGWAAPVAACWLKLLIA